MIVIAQHQAMVRLNSLYENEVPKKATTIMQPNTTHCVHSCFKSSNLVPTVFFFFLSMVSSVVTVQFKH